MGLTPEPPHEARAGVLLINLGTPDSPSTSDVRRYLREFLSDPRVLDMHPVMRALLLHCVILPFRPRKSAAAYRQIWDDGSPLLRYGIQLKEGISATLGEGFAVELAMRYGSPSIESGVARLLQARCERWIVVPLFPQYAEASTGSALARLFEVLPAVAAREGTAVPAVSTLPAFFDQPGFIESWAAVARGPLAAFRPDHVLLSYHGLPEHQVRKADPTGLHCLERDDCCAEMSSANPNCYRAQCHATSSALARTLSLAQGTWSIGFQSRLGRTPWIRPFSDELLPELAERGVRRLAVLTPAFVADCLETLEEIGIRMREQWRELGGEEMLLVPCPNADPTWVDALAGMIRDTLRAPSPSEVSDERE